MSQAFRGDRTLRAIRCGSHRIAIASRTPTTARSPINHAGKSPQSGQEVPADAAWAGIANKGAATAARTRAAMPRFFPSVRLAFNRVRDRVHAAEVNLHKHGDDMYIAALAQTRGRRRKGS